MSPEVQAAIVKVAGEITMFMIKGTTRPPSGEKTIDLITTVFARSYNDLLEIVRKED